MRKYRNYLYLFAAVMLAVLSGCNNDGTDNGFIDSIRVMTFNIRYNNPGDGVNAWTHRANEVVSMIKFYDADIIGTQEVLKDQKNYLDISLPDFNSIGVGRLDGAEKGEYSAIYFRKNTFELITGGTFWLSETPGVIASVGWDAAFERISTWAELRHKNSGKTFFTYNTHFDHIGEQARIKSAELILSKMHELSGDSPVVLIGDFNVTSDHKAYKTITGKMFDAQFKSIQPHHGPTWTFHGFESVELSKRGKIDHIFVNGKVDVLKHGVLSDRFDRGYPSDHLPVLADVVIK
jgi:endonuclease/exonuclease/phosphatase family metal-dependent hydrolase